MSGHSKWANIQHKKGIMDRKRSEAFTRLSKNILTAVRAGGGNTNLESNAGLRTAIDKAKESNMPKENIERLLKNFELRKANLQTFWLEGYGPGGMALMIEVESDNKNRTLGEIKLMMRDYGGSLGEEGCVRFLFDRLGETELESIPAEKELELIDLGVKEMGIKKLWVEVEKLTGIIEKIEAMGLGVVSFGVVMRAKTGIEISQDELNKARGLIESLEESDDVVNVFSNLK